MPDYNDQSHDHMINHLPHHRHHGDDVMRVPYDNRWAPCNDDQLPAINQVGRGIAGDSFVVRPKNDGNCEEFYLQGFSVDSTSGEETLEWESRNLSGGLLHDLNHTYRMRPWNDPPTFNMTFIYHKPPCCSWAWTTPAIPYCWDEKGEYPEKMVGTGVATLFVRTDAVDHDEQVGSKGNPKDDLWVEKLIYPEHTTREQFNAPDPLEEWTVNLTFGLKHGDVLVPNLYDLADITGFPANNLYNAVDDKEDQFGPSPWGTHWDNLKEYIDEDDKWLLKHFHDDLGFGDDFFEGDTDGGNLTVKDLLGWDIDYFLNGGTVKGYIDGLLDDMLKKIYPGPDAGEPTNDVEGNTPAGKVVMEDNKPHIKWATPKNVRIAQGNMNVYGGSQLENWIVTDEPGDNDLRGM